MRKLYRVTLYLLTLCLVFSCAFVNIASAEGDVELVFAAWAGANEKEVLEEALAGFTEETGIRASGLFIPSDYDTKISTMIASNTAPDVAYLTAGTAYDWYGDGKILDLAPLIAGDPDFNMDDLLETGYSYYDAEQINGLMLSLQTALTFYNADLFEKAGITPPAPDELWAWEDFVETAKLLTLDFNGLNATEPGFDPESIQQYGVHINASWAAMMEALLMRNTGMRFTTEDGSALSLNAPEVIAFIQKVADLITVEHCAASPTVVSGLPAASISLQTGRYAMVMDFQYQLSNFSTVESLNLGIAPIPGNDNSVALVSSGLKVIFSQTKHPDESWALMKWLNDPAQTLNLYSSGLWMPIMADWYTDAEKIELWAAEGVSHPKGYREAVLMPVMENSVLNSEHDLRNYNIILSDLLFPALDRVWGGEATAEEAIVGVMPDIENAFEGIYGK